MRIALLSTLELTNEGRPRALLQLGGRPLIAWQIDLAKALGCEKLLCLTEGDEEVAALIKKHASAAGFGVEFLGGPRHLLGKIASDQDLLVLADGLLIDPDLARKHLVAKRGIAAVSDYPGVEKGFERIDPERAWAGILVARGKIAEQLADMPADGDTISLLLRMALQAGTRVIGLDDLHLGTGELLLARRSEDLVDRERSMLDNSASHLSWAGPAEKIAGRLARRLAPDHFERGPVLALALGAFLMFGAAALSWYNFLFPGLLLSAFGAFAVSVSQSLRFLRARLHGQLTNRRFNMIINGLVDISIIGVLAIAEWPVPLLKALFEPVLLIGLWRLAAPLSRLAARPFWRDRTVLALLLSGLAGAGVLQQVLPALILVLLFYTLFSEASSRLTRA